MDRMPFITFEGSEGCGKSSQVQLVANRLDLVGIPFLVTREAGGTAIGESIRELLQFAPQSAGMKPETELLLFEASRAQLVREVIKPAFERGECVIADRFFDSTTVYQGVARKLDKKVVRQLNAFAVGDYIPDITFLLDVDLETTRARMKGPRRPDRMEQETGEFYEKVRDGYLELAKWQRDRVVVIEGWKSPHDIEKEIWETLATRFPELAAKSTINNQQSTI